MKKIAIFVSGNGSNAQNITEYFRKTKTAEIVLILSDKPEAYALERARKMGVDACVVKGIQWKDEDYVLGILSEHKVDYIILAGFLRLLPAYLCKKYEFRMLNIHPALLPAYAGKGMYGMNVHRAVIEAGENKSGISIHYVSDEYDAGDIVFQKTCSVENSDTPESLAGKVHALEYLYYPKIIENCLVKK